MIIPKLEKHPLLERLNVPNLKPQNRPVFVHFGNNPNSYGNGLAINPPQAVRLVHNKEALLSTLEVANVDVPMHHPLSRFQTKEGFNYPDFYNTFAMGNQGSVVARRYGSAALISSEGELLYFLRDRKHIDYTMYQSPRGGSLVEVTVSRHLTEQRFLQSGRDLPPGVLRIEERGKSMGAMTATVCAACVTASGIIEADFCTVSVMVTESEYYVTDITMHPNNEILGALDAIIAIRSTEKRFQRTTVVASRQTMKFGGKKKRF